jgi:hypothetical protein
MITFQNIMPPLNSTASISQRNYILSLLKTGATVSSMNFRSVGIVDPPARISEIKTRGLCIMAQYLDLVINGKKHKRIAHYWLVGGDK